MDCIKIFVVPSMLPQGNINESSTKQQWNIKISEIRSIKPLKIINVCIEIFGVTSLFLQRIINESSMNQQWNISDSVFNTTQTIKIKKVAIEVIKVPNMSLQRIISDHRRGSNETSMFRRLSQNKHLWSLILASKSSL